MMLNYIKSEWYRVTRGQEIYILTIVFSLLVLAMNLVLFATKQGDENFRYATVHFSLNSLTANMTILFIAGSLIAAILYADDHKNGTLKNAVASGISRSHIFFGKCIISILMSMLSMLFILTVYIGSALLLLDGPAAEAVRKMLEGIGAALPSAIAMIILTIAALCLFRNILHSLLLWISVVYLIPSGFHLLGLRLPIFQAVSRWMPANFLTQEVTANMAGFECLWNTPAGLFRCLAAGLICIVLFTTLGIQSSKKLEI